MSRTVVRHAVAAWLGGTPATNSPVDSNGNPLIYGRPSAVVPGVGTVYASWPKDDDDGDFIAGMNPGTLSGARLVVHMPGPEQENRAGLKMKRIDRRVMVQIFHRSLEPDPHNAQASFDTLMDLLTARIRIDPTLGTDSLTDPTLKVDLAGQNRYGVRAEFTQPVTDSSDVTEQYGQISFDITDFVIGY